MTYRNPTPTVDVIIQLPGERVVLIERANAPRGWAFPGGFVDYGESTEHAAIREAQEETGLTVSLHTLLGVYSAPDRDPRQHNLSVVYIASADQNPVAGDDAASAQGIPIQSLLDRSFAFDHKQIAQDYIKWLHSGALPKPSEGSA